MIHTLAEHYSLPIQRENKVACRQRNLEWLHWGPNGLRRRCVRMTNFGQVIPSNGRLIDCIWPPSHRYRHALPSFTTKSHNSILSSCLLEMPRSTPSATTAQCRRAYRAAGAAAAVPHKSPFTTSPFTTALGSVCVELSLVVSYAMLNVKCSALSLRVGGTTSPSIDSLLFAGIFGAGAS